MPHAGWSYSGARRGHRLPPPEARGLRARGRRRPLPPRLLPRLRPRRRDGLPHADRRRPAVRRRPRRAAGRGRARGRGRHRARARGRDRAALPAGGARPLLPRAGPRRRHRRGPRARVRRAARDARRRPHALRLLLRLRPLRPALRLPAVRAALARGAGEGPGDGRPGRRRSSRGWTRGASATTCARPGTRSAAATASPRCWSCCRGSRRTARAVPLAHYASGDLPGMQDDSSVVVRRDGLPARGARGREAFGPPLVALPRLEDAPPDTPALAPAEGAAARAARPRGAHHALLRARRPRPGARGVAHRARAGAPAGRLRHPQPQGPGGGPRAGRGSAAASASPSRPSRSTTAPCRPRSTRRSATRASSR